MFIVSLRLAEPADTVIFGIGTMTQCRQLRKDEPYPVTAFAPVRDFLQGIPVVETLRFKEALQVVTSSAVRRNAFHELLREDDILHINGIRKERGNLPVTESRYTAADTGYQEGKAWVIFGKADEVIHIRLDGPNASLHRRDGITLALEPDPIAPDRPELVIGQSCSTAAVSSGQIAALCKRLHKAAYVKSEIM